MNCNCEYIIYFYYPKTLLQVKEKAASHFECDI
jgi:hypothetical protein